MKRKNKKSPDAILTSDWHIRGDSPICRTDDYITAQAKKIEFILDLGNQYSCPILIAGDVGHRPIWGDKLLNSILILLKHHLEHGDSECITEIIAVAGQHDLINHKLDKIEEGGIGVLSKSLKNFNIMSGDFYCLGTNRLYPAPYSIAVYIPADIKSKSLRKFQNSKTIILAHQMVIKTQKDKLWPEQQAHSGKWFLKKYPCYDLIISGDNHQSFVVEYEGRLLVNPGSMMRMTANQIDHKPSVYLWYAESNTVERVYLPIEKGVISREHIEESQQRDMRIESFVNRLKDVEELGLSYEKNMEEFLFKNQVKKRIREKIWESME